MYLAVRVRCIPTRVALPHTQWPWKQGPWKLVLTLERRGGLTQPSEPENNAASHGRTAQETASAHAAASQVIADSLVGQSRHPAWLGNLQESVSVSQLRLEHILGVLPGTGLASLKSRTRYQRNLAAITCRSAETTL